MLTNESFSCEEQIELGKKSNHEAILEIREPQVLFPCDRVRKYDGVFGWLLSKPFPSINKTLLVYFVPKID